MRERSPRSPYFVAENENVPVHGTADIGCGYHELVPIKLNPLDVCVPVTLYVRFRLLDVL